MSIEGLDIKGKRNKSKKLSNKELYEKELSHLEKVENQVIFEQDEIQALITCLRKNVMINSLPDTIM